METTHVKNISYLFYNCSSLALLPDISKWDFSNIITLFKLSEYVSLFIKISHSI